jgi:hypothetical protein
MKRHKKGGTPTSEYAEENKEMSTLSRIIAVVIFQLKSSLWIRKHAKPSNGH